MRWPIRYQILIPFAGAMLIVVAAVSLLDAHLAARRSDDLVSGRLRDTARTLLDSNFPLTDSVLRQMRGLSGAEYVLTDGAGRSLAASGNLPGELPRPRRVSATWEEVELGQPIQLGSRPYFFTALAIPAARGRGEPLVLNIVYPRESLTQFRRAAAFPHLMVGAAAVALVALLSLAIAGRMCRPLVQVSRQVARLTDEAIHPLPLPPRDDELRDLVLSVNRLAAQLQEMRHAVQRSERLRVLGQLSGGMAHTLRNQATGARLAVQLHQRHCASSDAESLEVALRQLQLSEDHLRRFLAVGRPREPRQSPCDIDALLAEVASLVEPACRHLNVDLRVAGSAAPGPALWIDREQIRQALMNIVLNGIEAAGPGGWVRIEHDRVDQAAVVRVIDSGPGPPAELADRLFEPFATSKPEGVGLGLAVARRLLEGHGGGVCHVRRQDATCFELSLPIFPASSEVESPAEHERWAAPAVSAAD
jgi:signal transduction histidine kinase